MTIFAEFEAVLLRLDVYTSNDDCTGAVGSVTVEPDETYMVMNQEELVTAEETEEYEFLGWYPISVVSDGLVKGYDASKKLFEELSYSFEMAGETAIVAIFKKKSDEDPMGIAGLAWSKERKA